MAHVPVTVQLAYMQSVSDMQQAHDDSRGVVPIDRIIMNQHLSKMRSLLLLDIDVHDQVKFKLFMYHCKTKRGIDLTVHECALARWLIVAGNEHGRVIQSLDARPPSLRLIPAATNTVASHRGEGTTAPSLTAHFADVASLWEEPQASPAGHWDQFKDDIQEIESRQNSVALAAPTHVAVLSPPAAAEAEAPPGLPQAPAPAPATQPARGDLVVEDVDRHAPLEELQPRPEAQHTSACLQATAQSPSSLIVPLLLERSTAQGSVVACRPESPRNIHSVGCTGCR